MARRGKQKVVHKIQAAVWGKLVAQGIDVDTLSKDIRCVQKNGAINGGTPVTCLRIFKLSDAADRKIEVTGWETFDANPELILFEGHVTASHHVSLEKRS